VKRLVKLLLLVGIVAVVVAALRRRDQAEEQPPWPAQTPWPRLTDEPAPTSPPAAWVEPTGAGGCPDGYPVKAKVGSGIYHVEGGANYARTKPDRCYRSAEGAEADGLRPAKR
jgi:hypothetical protein